MNLTVRYLMILFVFPFFSCSDNYFDKYPEDELTEGVFYKNANDFEQAINEAYYSLRSTYQLFFAMGDIASDDAYNWKNNNSFDLISINESNVSNDNGILRTHWNSSYSTIARCNIVLDRIDQIDFEVILKNRISGEAKFLRALAYFNLVRVFGKVPLVVSEIRNADEAFAYERAELIEIYNLIVEDLVYAEENLPERYVDSEDIGRATSIAAKALLGKVFLTQTDYANAIEKLKEVVSSGEVGLLENYHDVFDPENPNNREIIFAVQYARNLNPSQGSNFAHRVIPNEPIGRDILPAGTGYGQFHMTDDLMKSFTKGDKRLSMVDSAIGNSMRQYYFTKKYFDPLMVKSDDAANDWIILRYSDVLLMLAEALNKSGNSEEALTYLNLVRERAGLEQINDEMNSATLENSILNERRIELNCEGNRWFDLVRTNRVREVMERHFNEFSYDEMQVGKNSSIEEHELIFPIPAEQVLLNPDKLSQNPGY